MPELTRLQKTTLIIILIFLIGMIIPNSEMIPVKNSTNKDWNHDTFWYEPWGLSGVHKGIDIFAKQGTEILNPATGFVLYAGEIELGGKIVVLLTAKWRIHYFAHLDTIQTSTSAFVSNGSTIGTVGSTGNAVGKQPHLHFSIITLVPYFWKIDASTQGWKKMFYLNPVDYFPENKH